MRVVDSSAWIEWLSCSALGQRLANEIPPYFELVVPTVVQYELKRWAIRNNADQLVTNALAYSNTGVVSQLDFDLAIKAAEYASQYSLAMADAIIYATAMKHGADLLTCDAHFASLPGVVYFPKTP